MHGCFMALPSSIAPLRHWDTWLRLLPGVVLLGASAVAILGDRGVLHNRALGGEVARLQREVESLDRANAELRQAMAEAVADDSSIERLARNELLWVREGEVVFEFTREPAAIRVVRPIPGGEPSGEAGDHPVVPDPEPRLVAPVLPGTSPGPAHAAGPDHRTPGHPPAGVAAPPQPR